ncbi:MAG: cell division protein FtsL [Candidatus Rifleibacteriota bacterium]
MASKQKILLNNTKSTTRASGRDEIQPAMDAKRRQIIRLYLTAIILLSMMFTVYIWQSTKMVEIKLRLNKSEKRIATLENNNSDLRAETSKLQSLNRIESIARNELGMIIPQKFIYLTMPDLKNK